MGWIVEELGKAASEAVHQNNPVDDFCFSSNGEEEEHKPLGSGGVGLTSTHLGMGVSTACWCG